MLRTNTLRKVVGTVAVLSALVVGTTPAVGTPVGWSTWGNGNARTGYNPSETSLSAGTVSGLHKIWKFTGFPAKTYTAPVFAPGVPIGVNNTPTDMIYAGDEAGNFVGLRADTGVKVWDRGLSAPDGLGSSVAPCYSFSTFGVSGTAVIDQAANRIYVVGGTGKLYALRLDNGNTVSGYPIQITQTANEYVWSALNLFNGHIYVPVASYCDSNGAYFGQVVRVDAANPAATPERFYMTDPTPTALDPNGVSGGGLWGWGGVSIDEANGNVYATTGNTYSPNHSESYLYGEHVIRLTENLSTVVSSNYPGTLGRNDADFGSTPVLFDGPTACGPQLATTNKSGELFIYNRDNINSGPEDRVKVSGNGLIAVPAYSPVTGLIYLGNPTASSTGVYTNALLAFKIRSTDCTLQLVWQQAPASSGGIVSSPTIANGIVYYGNGNGHLLSALDATTGTNLWNSGSSIKSGTSTEPVVVNGRVYLTSARKVFGFGL